MSQPSNPYAKKLLSNVSAKDDNNVSMWENIPSLKDSGFEELKHEEDDENREEWSQGKTNNAEEEEIEFEENHFHIPPLFNQPITEETLQDDNHPYVFWASLCLPIPKDQVNPMAANFNALEEFVVQLAEEDPHFIVFPPNLIDYDLVEDLPPPIQTPDNLPDDINKWLTYFPQAKPRISSGDMYTTLLIGLSIPFLKMIKNLSTWMWNKHYGL